MASSKEMQPTARPLTYRPSNTNAPNAAGALSPGGSSGLAGRQPHSRTSSHSIIGAALNANHRVSRRKSMTSPGATNVAAMAALIQEADVLPIPSNGVGGRRNTAPRSGGSGSPGHFPRGPSAMAAAMALANGTIGSLPLPSPPASLPSRKFVTADGSAIDDDLHDMSDGDDESALPKDTAGLSAFDNARIRRASDGQPLLKEGRRSSRMDLRCDKCGKGYKHSSCLTKHLWEHTPEWSYTSKLLISKHQQVQLLEAASVLVGMNNSHSHADATMVTTPPDSARDFASERDSASPTASMYSEQNDERGSVDTTPPPHIDGAMSIDDTKRELSMASSPPASLSANYRSFSQRFGSVYGNNGFAHSYQSGLPSGRGTGRNVSTGSAMGDSYAFGGYPGSVRPLSSGKNITGQEDNELAAAVELLSCSFNSGGTEGHVSSLEVPPVPPVPVQYFGQTPQALDDTSFISSFPSRAPESFTRGERYHADVMDDVMMEESSESLVDDEDDDRSRARSDDDDDGVFGRMEE